MKWAWIEFLIASAGLLPSMASAQEAPVLPAAAPTSLGAALWASLLLLTAAVLVLLAIGKGHDIWRARELRAVELEGRVREAFLEDPRFLTSPSCPSVRVPLWKAGPLVVELTGTVPTVEREQAALRLATAALAAVRPAVRIENRMTAGGSTPSHADPTRAPRTSGRFADALKSIVSVMGILIGVALFRYALLFEYFNF